MIDYLSELKKIATELGCYHLCKPVLEDIRFSTWSGSPSQEKHHYGDGGLLRHTYEVAFGCLENGKLFNRIQESQVNLVELFVSAIWHDYGKIWDYQQMPFPDNPEEFFWTGADHKRNIYHISRSGVEWMKFAEPLFDLDFVEKVWHNILAHHGCREWGSPVAPNSREAWILHLCDNMSARVCDVETLKRF